MILVTGGAGFLGRHVARELSLREQDYEAWGKKDANLEHFQHTLSAFTKLKPKTVIHLAATVGGIGANRRNPATFWRDNTLMGLNVLDACLSSGVKRLVLVSTTCGYPKLCPVPFKEEDLFNGYPEETNAPYGIAKRSLVVGAFSYQKQFGLEVVTVIPTNLYGIGDSFDPEDSHVVPALIRKIHEAAKLKRSTVELWGTGKATRDFLYVEDAARGIVDAALKGKEGSTINLGSGSEVSIAVLAETIAKTVGWSGRLTFDATKPDGQPRRLLDITKARKLLGWTPKVGLREGLLKTYEWFLTEVGK